MKNKIIKISGLVFLLSIFFLILFNLDSKTLKIFDEYIYLLVQTINTPFTTFFVKIVTSLASPEVVLFLVVLCLIFIKSSRIKKIIVMNSIVTVVLNQFIKSVVERSRPEAWMIVDEVGFSFPSAHAMFSLTFYSIFLYYISKSNIAKKTKVLLNILLIFLMITIPITRIYLGVHYASDVIAGLCLSGALLLIYSFFAKKEKKL